jgi:hypothetical protein
MAIMDETIMSGVALSGVVPEFVEWHGNPRYRVTIRIETHIGHYAEAWVYPHMTAGDVADVLRSLSRRLDER